MPERHPDGRGYVFSHAPVYLAYGAVHRAVVSIRHRGVLQRLAHLRAITRLCLAALAAALMSVCLPKGTPTETELVACWDTFAFASLLLTWLTLLTITPTQIQSHAQREDPSRVVSLAIVITAAGAALVAVVLLLQGTAPLRGGARTGAILLALSAVALAWLLIHTVFTLRYAHLYFEALETPAAPSALEFPRMMERPDYLDFAYFSFVIGMTAQTSDVGIVSRRIRRTALLHGIIAFAFNTAVVALTIGALTTLLP